jgi:hypothetical protein
MHQNSPVPLQRGARPRLAAKVSWAGQAARWTSAAGLIAAAALMTASSAAQNAWTSSQQAGFRSVDLDGVAEQHLLVVVLAFGQLEIAS